MGRHVKNAATPSGVSVDEAGLPAAPEEASLARRAGRGAAWAVAANLTMRVASVGVTALLARLLSKDDFGVFAVALAVYLVIASLAELGMASAVARSVDEPEDIAPTVASISILVGMGTGLAMAALAPAMASLLGQPEAAGPLRILSICVGLTGLFAVPGAQLVREFRQDRIFLSTIVGFVVSNPILVLLALHGGGAEAFAWSRVVGQVAGGVVFWFSTSRKYWPGWRSNQVMPLLAFGIPLSIANLVNWSLLNADYIILGRLVSKAEVGVYMIAFNAASWSTAILGAVLNSVVIPAFGRVRHDQARLQKAITTSCRLVAVISMPIGAVSIALADPIIRTVFSARWAAAAPVLSVLAIYGVLYAFTLLFANVLVATGQTSRLLLIQLSWVVVLVPSMVGGLHVWGLQGAAWAHVATICAVAVPGYLIATAKCTGSSSPDLLRTIIRPLVAALLAGLSAWLVALPMAAPWLRMLVGGMAGGLVYLAVAGPLLVALLPARVIPAWLPSRYQRLLVGDSL